MLLLTVKAGEIYNEETNEFFKIDEDKVLQLEHSLISLRKWEAKHHKPFLDENADKTPEETLDYIRCMTLNPNVPDSVYQCITKQQMVEIADYIKNPMTATWFNEKKKEGEAPNSKKETVTAEIIYYWMISLNIPIEFQKWHLNQLMTLIKVLNIKNAPQKKMTAKEAASQRQMLNAARRAKSHSKG